MDVNLERDLVFLDVETTGLNVLRDRIVQIAMIKYPKNGGPTEERSYLVNPGIPISEESISIHGITAKDVARKPTFVELAPEIYDFIGNADIGGYNSNRFDVPMLMEEFDRAGLDFDVSKRRLIDVQRIFYKMEPRTLRAALKFYCGETLKDAHDALSDVRATVEVFKGQLAMYEGVDLIDEDEQAIEQPIRRDIQAIHDFINDLRTLDVTQKLRLNHEGVPVFNFGKYINQPVAQVLARDKQYYNWILNMEFSAQVKQLVRKIMKDYGETAKNS
jgi:DNA polymerase-3 subunit epsilon